MLWDDSLGSKHKGLWGLIQFPQVSGVSYRQQPSNEAPEDPLLSEADEAAQENWLSSSDEASEATTSWLARMEVNWVLRRAQAPVGKQPCFVDSGNYP